MITIDVGKRRDNALLCCKEGKYRILCGDKSAEDDFSLFWFFSVAFLPSSRYPPMILSTNPSKSPPQLKLHHISHKATITLVRNHIIFTSRMSESPSFHSSLMSAHTQGSRLLVEGGADEPRLTLFCLKKVCDRSFHLLPGNTPYLTLISRSDEREKSRLGVFWGGPWWLAEITHCPRR